MALSCFILSGNGMHTCIFANAYPRFHSFIFVSSPSLFPLLLYVMNFCAHHCMVFSCVGGGGSLGMCGVWFFLWFFGVRILEQGFENAIGGFILLHPIFV